MPCPWLPKWTERHEGQCSKQTVCIRLADDFFALQFTMFALLKMTMLDDVNTINEWAEPHNANGVTPNTVIDSNDEPPCNNQQRMTIRAY
mmetsp:Transcript_99967/g.149796  ORF Transcript_99967/g.149796 Transcript_99967/m.149796 type:complete len:90 (-) Transcript_99967:65-334(-)